MLALYSITSPNASKAATQKTRMVVATFNSQNSSQASDKVGDLPGNRAGGLRRPEDPDQLAHGVAADAVVVFVGAGAADAVEPVVAAGVAFAGTFNF